LGWTGSAAAGGTSEAAVRISVHVFAEHRDRVTPLRRSDIQRSNARDITTR
jgi:hypothetical protein